MAQAELRLPTKSELSDNRSVSILPEKIDESEIWKNFKNGDEASFIWIYQEYFGKLYNYSMQFNFEEEVVKDHIQELFIYIRKNRERLADVNSIKFYLYKSIRRRLLSGAKRKFSIISIFSSDQNRVFELSIADSAERQIIDQGTEQETKIRLTRSLNKLTPRQREAVQHFYYEGLSYHEIAEVMDLKKVKYARKLIYRAIDSLRKDLQSLKSLF